MAIPRPENMHSPRHGVLQPMVKYCPCCKGDLENITSRGSVAEDRHSHNDWCVVCERIFEINDLQRGGIDDNDWIAAGNINA